MDRDYLGHWTLVFKKNFTGKKYTVLSYKSTGGYPPLPLPGVLVKGLNIVLRADICRYIYIYIVFRVEYFMVMMDISVHEE
jgi:hypothetical protein